jgi:hypothetical protein
VEHGTLNLIKGLGGALLHEGWRYRVKNQELF